MTTIILPHQFHDNADETASGAQLMDNLNTLKGPLDQAIAFIAPEGTALTFRYGVIAGTTDGGGNIPVTYATPFPTGTLTVVATSLNLGGSPVYRCTLVTAAGFTAFFNVKAEAENFNYIAIGH